MLRRGIWDVRWLALALLLVPGVAQAQIDFGAATTDRLILYPTPAAATATTGEEVLQAVTVPANTWNVVGATVRIRAVYTTAANTNSKTFRIRYAAGTGGVVLCGGATTTSAASFVVDTRCTRTTSGELACWGQAYPATTPQTANQTGINFAADVALSINGLSGTSAGEIVLQSVLIEREVTPR